MMLFNGIILGCREVTDRGIKALSKLPKLEIFILDDVRGMTDEAFKNFTTLKKLHCSKCHKIDSAGLADLVRTCEKIEKITLYDMRDDIASDFLRSARSLIASRTNGIPLTVHLKRFTMKMTPVQPESDSNTKVICEVGNYDQFENSSLLSRSSEQSSKPIVRYQGQYIYIIHGNYSLDSIE